MKLKHYSLDIPQGSDAPPKCMTVVDASNVEFEYSVILTNGEIDEVRYPDRDEAYNSLIDCERIMDIARKHFAEEGWKQDEIDLANYISTNIRSLSEEAGYDIYPWVKGVK